MYAIPLSSTGEFAAEDALWTASSGAPYVPSPIVSHGRLYMTAQNTGVLSCLDASDGHPVFGPQRLPEIASLYASPISAAGRLYFVGRDGTTAVLAAGDSLQVLAVNRLEDAVDASPVAVGRQLLLRGSEHVYCVESALQSP